MKRLALILAASLALPGCADKGGIDVCRYAGVRRQVYATAITAAIAYEASGRIVPYSLAMGRKAAETALTVLNTNCPAP
jgi:hypothetical protein